MLYKNITKELDMTQATKEEKNKFKFMCDEIDGYIFDLTRSIEVYIGLVRRESPDSVPVVESQCTQVMEKVRSMQEEGRNLGTPEGLPVLASAVALCVDTFKRVEVAVNQFSQTQIRVESK